MGRLPAAICATALSALALPAQCANVIDITPGTVGSGANHLTSAFGQQLYFSQYVANMGSHLWKWDASSGAPVVSGLTSGPPGVSPEQLTPCCTALGPRLFFSGHTFTHGLELYMSDGTSAGTARVKDIAPGAADAIPRFLVACDERLFFAANDGTHGEELWVSDGTAAGTSMVLDIAPGLTYGRPETIVPLHGKVLFSAYQTNTGRELWVSDGTAAGTQMLMEFVPGTGWGDPWDLTRVGDFVYFVAATPAAGAELWRTDGTVSGTVLVADIFPGTQSSSPSDLCACGDRIFFEARLNLAVRGLFVSDGTAAGTTYLNADPFDITCSGKRVFFRAEQSTTGYELWTSDGTVAGTHLVLDLVPGVNGSNPTHLVDGGSGVFFRAQSTVAGELWFSDGTAAGTTLVCNLATSDELTMCRGHLFFTANDPAIGREIFWVQTPGASATLLGNGGRPDYPTLATLDAGVPVLGTTLDLVAAGPSAQVGFLMASGPSLPGPSLMIPGLLDGGCDHVSMLAGLAINLAVSVTPDFTWSFVLPNNLTLEGIVFHFQVLWWDPVGAPLFQVSNGLQLALGTAMPH
jgi:ELWxxDGT repeat protein